MRGEYTPGDLSVRLGFGRVYGNGPDRGKVRPTLSVTDQTSGLTLEIPLTAEQLAEMMSGSEAQVSAADVTGFKGLIRWGKYLKVKQLAVKSRHDDYRQKGHPRDLPHVGEKVAELEADGYRVDRPSESHGNWRIVGRRYDDQP